jgi:hypothetical protein
LLSQGSAGSIPVLGTKAFPTKLEGLFYLGALKARFHKRINEKAPTAEGVEGV